jgi:hypothetical protein
MHVMNRFLTRACVAAAAGVALSTVAVTGASASDGGVGGVPARSGAIRPVGLVAGGGWALHPISEHHAVGRGTATLTNTRDFAGYGTAVTAGSATSSAATFIVPTLSCTTASVAIVPNVAVTSSHTFSGAGAFTQCANGKAGYFPVLVVNGTEKSYTSTPLSAGDVINLSASVTASGTTVQVTDVTKNVTKTLTGAGASASSALIGDEAVSKSTGGFVGVPNFGKLKYTNCLIDGTALQTWNPQQFQRVNAKGIVQIATGPFSPAPAAFATYYRHI